MTEGKSIGTLAGDLFANIAQQRAATPPRTLILKDAVRAIEDERPTSEDVSFIHSILCQIGLPRAKVDGDTFERTSMGTALKIRAGEIWNGRELVTQIVPYGPLPRLIMAYISTYALRHNTTAIPFGDSNNDALRLLGIEKAGTTFRMFRTQLSALSSCSMTLGFNVGEVAHTFHGQPVEHFEAWIAGAGDQRALWPSAIHLSQRYFDTLKDHAVPHDLRALSSLKGSAMAMDIYLFLAARLFRVKQPGSMIYWHNLRDQFGQEYNDPKNFKATFKKALAQAMAAYPDANVSVVPGGIKLRASRPAVDPRESGRVVHPLLRKPTKTAVSPV